MLVSGCGDGRADPLGEWTVVSHRFPGISAMSEAEASAWHGRTIHFAPTHASSGADTCRQPAYRHRPVPADSFLSADFGILRARLGPTDSIPSRLELTEIACGGTEWTALGGRLLWLDQERAYSVWDGVFFELRRK